MQTQVTHTLVMHTLITHTHSSLSQNLLRLSFGGTAPGVSPEATFQAHSLPSSVSDALEAMGLDDLTMEEIDSTNNSEDTDVSA